MLMSTKLNRDSNAVSEPRWPHACEAQAWHPMRSAFLIVMFLLALSLIDLPCVAADKTPLPEKPDANQVASPNAEPEYQTESLRGKVVWLDEALERLYGITTEPDAAHTQVVLEMADGRLWPLVPDTRGRCSSSTSGCAAWKSNCWCGGMPRCR